MNDSLDGESMDQVSQLKAELEEMQERVDALEEENKALSDQVVSLTMTSFCLSIVIDAYMLLGHRYTVIVNKNHKILTLTRGCENLTTKNCTILH